MRKIFKDIWGNVRQGENIDTYITILVVFILGTLNIIGFAPQSWITSAILAALGILAISGLKLSARFDEFIKQRNFIRVYEEGRPNLKEVVETMKDAKYEIIHIGQAMNTLANNLLGGRREDELREPTLKLLESGVKFRFLVLDNKATLTKIFAQNTGEPELLTNIEKSLETFSTFRKEKSSKYQDAIEVRLYTRIPSFYIMMVDRDSPQGRAYISHYIHPTIQERKIINKAIMRVDTPHLEVYKSKNPKMFEAYNQLVTQIIESSKIYSKSNKVKVKQQRKA